MTAPSSRIEAWENGRARFSGTVSEVASHRGIMWVRQDATGLRRLVSARSHRLRRCAPVPAV